MSQQSTISFECYLCHGKCEFEARLADQIAECPHCGQNIKLLANETKTGPIVITKAGRVSLTKGQKWLTWIALGMVCYSFFSAPWRVSTPYGDQSRASIQFSSIFSPPSGSEVINVELAFSVLLTEWLAISFFYMGLFYWLYERKKKSRPGITEEQARRRAQVIKLIHSLLLGIGISALSVVGITVILNTYYNIVNQKNAPNAARPPTDAELRAMGFVPIEELTSNPPAPTPLFTFEPGVTEEQLLAAGWRPEGAKPNEKAVRLSRQSVVVSANRPKPRFDLSANVVEAKRFDESGGDDASTKKLKAAAAWKLMQDFSVTQSVKHLNELASQNNMEGMAEILLDQAQNGNPKAQAILGYCYKHGTGVPVDLIEAYKWFYASVQNGEMSMLQERYETTKQMTPETLELARRLGEIVSKTNASESPLLK